MGAIWQHLVVAMMALAAAVWLARRYRARRRAGRACDACAAATLGRRNPTAGTPAGPSDPAATPPRAERA